MGTVFSRGERPEDLGRHMALDGEDSDASMNGHRGSNGRGYAETYGLTVNVTMPSYSADDLENGNGVGGSDSDDAAADDAGDDGAREARGVAVRPGQLMQRFSLPDPGSYLKMEFNQLTLYVDADGRMELFNEGRPAMSIKASGRARV